MKRQTGDDTIERNLSLTIREAIAMLLECAGLRGNLQMPGDPRYQPDDLKPLYGYDQIAGWLVIVEWFWMLTLARVGVMPMRDARYLTRSRLRLLLRSITTTMQDAREYGRDGKKGTRHDIKALLELMRALLPKPLKRWPHDPLTSYDPICTIYALILKVVFELVVWPKMVSVDSVWCEQIATNARTLKMARTHLQDALPATVGFWLANLHARYVNSCRMMQRYAAPVPGKLRGAVGTNAAGLALGVPRQAERMTLEALGLAVPRLTTQITHPEPAARYYFEWVLLSGALGNLGEDCRLLQSSAIGELVTFTGGSSTMAQKANPITAENGCGMHVNVIAEFVKVLLTLISDLERDLRWSSVMRSFPAVVVYGYQQLLGTERLLKSMVVHPEACQRNFDKSKRQVMAELLQLALKRAGYLDSHRLTNETLVPLLGTYEFDLADAVGHQIATTNDQQLVRAWRNVPPLIKRLVHHPEEYLGDAVRMARREAKNVLK